MALSLTATRPTLVEIPDARSRLAWAALLVVVGVAFIAALAQIRIPNPPSPVPITGQTLAVLLIGAAYGWRLGTITAIAYIAAGIAGLPLFTAGNSGWAYFTGATGGYLGGFVLAAALVGWLAEHGWDRQPWLVGAAMVLGNAVIYVCGVAWLVHISPRVGWGNAWAFGVGPFLVGDALKIAIAEAALPLAWWAKERGR